VPYYYECSVCQTQHGFDPAGISIFSEGPQRSCHECGVEGCIHCVSNEVCSTCIAETINPEPAPCSNPARCTICSQGWTHGA
jgi:hypothetical protein